MLKQFLGLFMLFGACPISCMELTEIQLLEEIRAKKHRLHELPFTHVIINQATRDMKTARDLLKYSCANNCVFAIGCHEHPAYSQTHDIAKAVLIDLNNNSEKPESEHDSLVTILKNAHATRPHLEALYPYSFASVTFFRGLVTVGCVHSANLPPSILCFQNKYVTNLGADLRAPDTDRQSIFSLQVNSIYDTNALVLLGGIGHRERAINALMHHKGDMQETIKELHESSRQHNDMYTMSVTYMTAAAYLCAYDKESNQTK